MSKYDPDTWFWWAGRDDERFTVGPCDTRAEAISEGISEFGGEPFHIIEAKHGRAHWRILDSDYLAERFDEANEEMGDPDGDPLSTEIKDEAWKEIAERLNNVLEAWGREQSIHTWGFSASRNAEAIDPTVAHAWADLDSEARTGVLSLIEAFERGEAWGFHEKHALDALIAATNPVLHAFVHGMRAWAERVSERRWREQNAIANALRQLPFVFANPRQEPTP